MGADKDNMTQRERVLNAISKALEELNIPESAGDTNTIADAVFDELYITHNEQESKVGVFRLYTGKES